MPVEHVSSMPTAGDALDDAAWAEVFRTWDDLIEIATLAGANAAPPTPGFARLMVTAGAEVLERWEAERPPERRLVRAVIEEAMVHSVFLRFGIVAIAVETKHAS